MTAVPDRPASSAEVAELRAELASTREQLELLGALLRAALARRSPKRLEAQPVATSGALTDEQRAEVRERMRRKKRRSA